MTKAEAMKNLNDVCRLQRKKERNTMAELYTKVQQGNRVRYVPLQEKAPPLPPPDFTDEEIITLGVSVGAMILIQLEQNIPEHKRNRRKVKAVTDALMNLAHGNGKPIDTELIDYWTEVWNTTMKRFQSGLEGKTA